MNRWLFHSGIVLIILVLAISCDTENSVEPYFEDYYIKYYGGDGDQEAKDFLVNNDGSIIIVGTSFLGQTKRIYLLKVDAEGNELWKKTLGSDENEIAQDIEPIIAGPDAGNFVVLSNVEKNSTDFAIRLTLINNNGDSLKNFLFDELVSQEARTITTLSDGGYILAGKTIDTDVDKNAALLIPDTEDLLIIRLQSDFSFIPANVERVGSSSIGSMIKIFEQGSSIFQAGYSDELIGNEIDYESNFVFRSLVNNNLTTIYAGTSTQHEYLSSVARSPSGVYMGIGTQTNLAGGARRIFAATISNNFSLVQAQGTIVSASQVGGVQYEGVAVAPSGVSRFLVLSDEITASGTRNISLMKVGLDLNIDFEVKFGATNNNDRAAAVAELPNGDILVLGTMNLVNQNKIALIKLRSDGQF